MRGLPIRPVRWLPVAAILCVLAATFPAAAQAPQASVTISGQVGRQVALDIPALQAMPPVTVEVTHETPKGPQTTAYTGVLLWILLKDAQPTDSDGPRTRLQHSVLARGRDGYAVALAWGEMDPEFEGKQVLVAYARAGQVLSALQLVVPADKRAARSVHELVAIEIR